jgi:biopolymer transport protein ExbD
MKHASVTNVKMRSPLRDAMKLGSNGAGRSKKKMVTTLILTSLVDAFSIMLLYLLVQNTGNGSTIELQKAEKLPVAVKTEALHEGTLVRIEGRQYFLGTQPITSEQLAQKLQEKKASLNGGLGGMVVSDANDALIIQADKNADFAMLTPVIRAGSVSGFHKFKFAVLQGESKL